MSLFQGYVITWKCGLTKGSPRLEEVAGLGSGQAGTAAGGGPLPLGPGAGQAARRAHQPGELEEGGGGPAPAPARLLAELVGVAEVRHGGPL
jgi:hypothetical protein